MLMSSLLIRFGVKIFSNYVFSAASGMFASMNTGFNAPIDSVYSISDLLFVITLRRKKAYSKYFTLVFFYNLRPCIQRQCLLPFYKFPLSLSSPQSFLELHPSAHHYLISASSNYLLPVITPNCNEICMYHWSPSPGYLYLYLKHLMYEFVYYARVCTLCTILSR